MENNNTVLALIKHEVENWLINQRIQDWYINATSMCKIAWKLFADYKRLNSTKEFLNELSPDMGIPITGLIQTIQGWTPELQWTWIHPQVAIHLAQWLSPKFAVAVSKWVFEWLWWSYKERVPYHLRRYVANMSEIPPTHFSMLNELTYWLIAPLEKEWYELSEKLVPDISTGRMFSDWLRNWWINPTDFSTYSHKYEDWRVVQARLYPNKYLWDFRNYFYDTWLPQKAILYFEKKDPLALVHMPKLLWSK